MEKICGIYMIENIVNKRIYIGSSKDVDKRIWGHFNALAKGKHKSSHLQNSYDKYGKDNFEGKILITCHSDMLLWYEQQFIDQWHPEYNKSNIAGKVEWTEDLKDKQSKSMIGNQNSKGHIHSPESRSKISDRLKGKKQKPEVVAARIGRKHTIESRQKISESLEGNNYHTGWKDTVESRTKMSVIKQGTHRPNDVKIMISESMKVYCAANKEIRKISSVTRNSMSESAKVRYRREKIIAEDILWECT